VAGTLSALLLAAAPAHAATPTEPHIAWRHSTAVGQPWAGRLVNGVKLPAEGPDWFTWDPALNVQPDRWWRRWGTDTLVHTVLDVVSEYRLDNPDAPRVGIGDLSRPHGGWFGREYGGLGHDTHQNGRDVDVWYPRKDGTERRAFKVADVDQQLAQDLVDDFVDAGAVRIFVGPHTHLYGPKKIVSKLAFHDDHLHVRIAQPR
jgi:murein endopeptidase